MRAAGVRHWPGTNQGVCWKCLGARAEVLNLGPDTELHALRPHVSAEFGESIGEDHRVGFVIAELAAPVLLVVPAGVKDEDLRADPGGHIGEPLCVGDGQLALEWIPGVELHQRRLVGGITRHHELALVPMQMVRNIVKAACGSGHRNGRQLESPSGRESQHPAGIEAHAHAHAETGGRHRRTAGVALEAHLPVA